MQAIELETTISPQGAIALPADCKAFYGRQARMILLLADEPEPAGPALRRSPPPQLAGKVRELGDVMGSVSPADWQSRNDRTAHKPEGEHDASL